jgi:CxxC motif-containing protein (DUF1111 family)
MPYARPALVASRAWAHGAALGLSAVAALCSMGHAALGGETELAADDRFNLALGQVVFRKQWVSAPSSTTSSDGLGPLYNARACAQCHPHGGRGQPEPDRARGLPSALVLRLSVPPTTAAERALLATGRANVVAEPTYGVQLQPFAIQGHRSEGRLAVSYEERAVTLGDGSVVRLRKPSYRVTDRPLRSSRSASPSHGPRLRPARPGRHDIAAGRPAARRARSS